MTEPQMHRLSIENIDNGWLVQVYATGNNLIGSYAFTTGRTMLALLVTLLQIDGNPDRIECGKCHVYDTSGAFVKHCRASHCPLKGLPG